MTINNAYNLSVPPPHTYNRIQGVFTPRNLKDRK